MPILKIVGFKDGSINTVLVITTDRACVNLIVNPLTLAVTKTA